jgi:glucose-6-phosphate isomerase
VCGALLFVFVWVKGSLVENKNTSRPPPPSSIPKQKKKNINSHLKDLLRDEARCDALFHEHDGVLLDMARQRMTAKTEQLLLALADRANLRGKIDAMFGGDHINSTEDRAVLHVALRAPRDAVINTPGEGNVVPQVWEVLDKIKDFSERVRSGEWLGATGKPLTNVVAIGIGGSFLGPLFVHTALRTDQESAAHAAGRTLRFLANVDPIDVARALNGLDPATTLVVVVSKTFTTVETMLNARTVRTWLKAELGEAAVAKHMVAVSTNLKLVREFGIDPANAFAFWDWVGGRYSVTSAVGVLPLALQYGFGTAARFLEGAWAMDTHFRDAPFAHNLPVQLGLSGIWNSTFLGYSSLAILPYCQALAKLAPHIQQVSMESNGKGVTADGTLLPFKAGEIDFGEPGTNGQHSFYQV